MRASRVVLRSSQPELPFPRTRQEKRVSQGEDNRHK